MVCEKKFNYALPALISLCCIFPASRLIEASIRNGKEKSPSSNESGKKDYSSNQLSADLDVNPKFVDEHLYYLPKQTEFGSTSASSVNGVPITSPPHLTIISASMQTSYQQSSDNAQQNSYIENDDYIIPYQSHCISETPSINTVKSQILLPSETSVKESVIMSGRLEIASKTTENSMEKILNEVSQPSAALQGTHVHAHSITDM